MRDAGGVLSAKSDGTGYGRETKEFVTELHAVDMLRVLYLVRAHPAI